jgi:predicted histidine transporter YuiF (NhaC family)
MACPSCAERAQFELPKDNHGRYLRGLLFGIGGAIIGLILYATFEIATGLIIGYVSLAVGYIVGKAIKMGSRGAGGRKYQITAVVLTYAAVSLAAVPVMISFYAKTQKARQAQSVQQQQATDDQDQEQSTQPGAKKHMSLGAALLQLTFVGLTSPFLDLAGDPFHGLIGLVILVVGIRIAWKLTAGTETQIFGPFENAVGAPSSS